MLKDSLYTIKQFSETANSIEAAVELNVGHDIFKGHFPVHAVLPGACMLQMVKELLEASLKLKLQMVKADEIKFLHMIEPEENVDIKFYIEHTKNDAGSFSINAKIINQDAVCYKMKAVYK